MQSHEAMVLWMAARRYRYDLINWQKIDGDMDNAYRNSGIAILDAEISRLSHIIAEAKDGREADEV